MTGWLIGLGLWGIAIAVLGPLVGRLIRNGRCSSGPPVVWDGSGDPWDRDPVTGLYRLRAVNSDQLLQAMSLDDIEQLFGTPTFHPRTEQDPTT